MQMLVKSLVPFLNGLATQVLMLMLSAKVLPRWLGTHGESCPTKTDTGENRQDGNLTVQMSFG